MITRGENRRNYFRLDSQRADVIFQTWPADPGRGNDDPDRGNETMKNPATIPTRVMQEIEARMERAADLQQTRRHVIRHHGAQHWQWYLGNPFSCAADRRSQAARAVLEARRMIRENGYETWHVCAIARDPGAFAFCDGGGATPENIDQ